jgi:hypothetical protein
MKDIIVRDGDPARKPQPNLLEVPIEALIARAPSQPDRAATRSSRIAALAGRRELRAVSPADSCKVAARAAYHWQGEDSVGEWPGRR